MDFTPDVHYQFASFFRNEKLLPYAYLVSKKLSEGHICLRLKNLDMEMLPFLPAQKPDPKTDLKSIPIVSKDPGNRQPFVLHGDNLYLHRYFHYESMIIERITSMIGDENKSYNERKKQLDGLSGLIQNLFPVAKELQSPDWQLAAAISAFLNDFTIITGGPGTGKTTTVAKILALMFSVNPGCRVALAAPTGKAAARMAESLKTATLPQLPGLAERFSLLKPSTLHRLLGYIPNSTSFKHNRDNPLPYDLVLIDESSMLDASMLARVLDAVGPSTKIILLGDKDQLASVEAGSLFGDLCRVQATNRFTEDRYQLIHSFSNTKLDKDALATGGHIFSDHVIELQHSYRFSDEKGIGRLSKAIVKNDHETISAFFNTDDEEVKIDQAYSNQVFEQFISGYADYINEGDIKEALKKLNLLRVLCAIKEGEHGLYSINRRIEGHLHQKGLIKKTGQFYQNRPIIVTSNHYNLGLYNGDTGIIRQDDKGIMRAWFDMGEEKPVSFLPGYINQCETVFAMTVHKSQGSEFNDVMMVLPDLADIPILTRELLYTGITRARKKVIIQARPEILLKASEALVQRGSGLVQRFSTIKTN